MIQHLFEKMRPILCSHFNHSPELVRTIWHPHEEIFQDRNLCSKILLLHLLDKVQELNIILQKILKKRLVDLAMFLLHFNHLCNHFLGLDQFMCQISRKKKKNNKY